MSHTVTITQLADDEHDLEYEIGGTCERSCSVWYTCRRTRCQRVGGDLDNRDVHGVYHARISGEWMVDSGQCALKVADPIMDYLYDLTQLGAYELDVDWDGDNWIALPASEPTTVADEVTE
jgi:hypothetical protein